MYLVDLRLKKIFNVLDKKKQGYKNLAFKVDKFNFYLLIKQIKSSLSVLAANILTVFIPPSQIFSNLESLVKSTLG